MMDSLYLCSRSLSVLKQTGRRQSDSLDQLLLENQQENLARALAPPGGVRGNENEYYEATHHKGNDALAS